jgi:phenylpropionate dioxygenase-like ring-hydroxylating dioxygenase large terminal subunit
MKTIVRNVWYVAAWAREVSSTPLARRICDTPVVLFRGQNGKVGALEDRCSHRGLPLAKGRVIGDVLQCGYHGLCFDTSGECTKVPGQERIPSRARVQNFPVVEQEAVVWIWMGEPSQADASRIPRFPRHVDPSWNWRGEYIAYNANHLLLYDNLLDLSHVGYVHPNTIGGNEEEHSAAGLTIERGAGWVKGVRWMRNSVPPQAYQQLRPFPGRIDRWQVMRFEPGLVRISVGAKDAGTARHDEDYEDAYESHGFHGVTPASEGECHYFWSVGVPASFDKPGLIDRKIELTRITFEEDREVLEAQYARRREDPDRAFVDIRSDALGLAARRIWNEMMAQEASTTRAADAAPMQSN